MNPTIPLRIHVQPERLATAPGETAQMTLSVFNTSDIIDGFDITVVGADQSWVNAEPDWISLFPDTEGTVTLRITLPADFPAGRHELGVKVTSRTTNEVFAVGAVALDVAEKTAATVDVDPDAVVAGRRGRFSVIVANQGNVPIDVAIDAADDGGVLSYDVTPTRIQLGPSESRTCQLVVTAPRPITGTAAVRPFIVMVSGPGVELAVPATLSSRPWIPRWLLSFLAIALLLGLWAFIVGLALDAIMDDMNQDLAEAFEQGIASVVAAVAPGAGGDPGDVVTGPAGTVPGLVTTAVDGTPIPGASATATALISAGSRAGEVDPDRDPVEIASGDDGSFAFEDMVRGAYAITVSGPGYVTSDPVTIEVPFDGEPLVVELVGAPGLVSGVVLAGGEPLENAAILVRRLDPATGNAISPEGVITEDPLRSVLTPETGRFAVDELATPATYELDVSSPGFTTMRVIVDLTAGQRMVGLELELAGAGVGSITGSVSDAATGDLLGGVSVAAAGDGVQIASTTLTEATGGSPVGSYRVGGLPFGEYTATFSLAGYDDVALPFTITAEAPTVALSPQMNAAAGAPIGTVQGTVTEADSGARLGGASVAIAGEGGQFTVSSLTQAGDGLEVGSFRLQSLPIGSYTATVTLANYDPVAIPFTVSAEDPVATLSPRMSLAANAPVGQLTGTVTDAVSGSPLGGVTVTVTGEGVTLTTVTFTDGDAAGSFILNAIPTGSYTAAFTLVGYEPVAQPFTVSAESPSATLTATMSFTPDAAFGQISGTVTDAVSGAGLGGITVTVTGEGVTLTTVTFTDGETGAYRLNAIPGGSYTATFTAPTHETVATPFEISPTNPAQTMSPSMTPVPTPVSGLVEEVFQGEGGPWTYPLSGVTVRYRGETIATTGANGEFSAVVVAAQGAARFVFIRPGYASRSVDTTITPGTALNLGAVQMYPTGTLSGSFVDAFGRNVGGPGNVTLTVTDVEEHNGLPPIDPASISPRTQAMGATFTFPNLAGPATYTIRATFGPGTTPFRQLYAGAVTFTAHVYYDTGIGTVTVPYAPRVVWGTLSCYGYPAQGPVGLTTNLSGGPPVRQANPDDQGRVAIPQVATGTYLLGVVWVDEGGNPWVYSTYPPVFVTFPGTTPPVNSSEFCGGEG